MFGGFRKSTFTSKAFVTRRIGNIGAVSDSDADRFVQAASITDDNDRAAIYLLVQGLKRFSLWEKLRLIYPMVGADAAKCSFNLKNPALFQITWVNAPTFTANGVQGNGSNQYGTIAFTPSTQLTVNNASLGVYIRTNGYGTAFGSEASGPAYFYLNAFNGGGAAISFTSSSFGTVASTGFFAANKIAAGNIRTFHNGTFKNQGAANSASISSAALALLARRNVSTIQNYSDQQVAFAFVGESLTDEDAANLYSVVQEFQTFLGRQV